MSKKSKSKKANNSENAFELSPVTVRIALWIVNTQSEFKVNIFSNNRGITKCHSFCNDDNDAKAIAELSRYHVEDTVRKE